jgi:regulator of sirC expression with transglutaminase-like and TPR domain
MRVPALITCLLLLGWPCGLSAEELDDGEPTPQLIAEIRRHIRDLDADSFEAREAAQRQLWLIGPRTMPFLEEAAQSGSPEVRFRADALLRSIHRGPIKTAIETFCSQADEAIDLEQGMWLMSRIGNPKVRRQDLDRQYDEIAAQVREKLGKEVDPATAHPKVAVMALRTVIFEDLRFNTNKDDYDNPDNCFPERVLATRMGRPIFVSHVVVAVAKRLKIPIVGLPVSGMYCVKYDGAKAPKDFPREDIVFYPHDEGRVLSREEFPKLLGVAAFDSLPTPATPRQALVRMLSNLTSVLDHQPDRAEELQLANEMLQRLKRASDEE